MAGSDTNKSAIVQKGGMDRLIKLAARFSDDPSVLQEVGKSFIQMILLVSITGNYIYIVIGNAASILNLKLCLINICQEI